MTCIELFDRNFADNICSCLAFYPERVVLVGKEKSIVNYAARYEKIFKERGCDSEFIPVIIDKNDMSKIISSLSKIVEEYDDCTFDLTGGDDQYLVAVGIILERYKGKVQAHCISARNGELIDCDCDGIVLGNIQPPYMSFDESIGLYGGKCNKALEQEWNLDEEFLCDLEKMWEICIDNPNSWNDQVSYLTSSASRKIKGENLRVSIPSSELKPKSKRKEDFNVDFVEKLYKVGLFTEFFYDENVLNLKYKNEQVKRCFSKEGQVLELKVYSLVSLVTEGGKRFYNDFKTGVSIFWENNNKNRDNFVNNEIDVVAMKGMVPIFISCKNGWFSSDELYKLLAVTETFGGKYAKKIVVTTNKESAQACKARAKELKIGIVLLTKDMKKPTIDRKIRGLWSNNG